MFNKIIEILKEEGIENWRVSCGKTETAELYFIKKQLDIPRIKKMTQYVATVFNDFEIDGKKFRGQSVALIAPGATDEEIRTKIKNAYLAAGFVKNPWFEFADPACEAHKPSTSDMAKMDLKDAVVKFAKEVFTVDTAKDAFINSIEFFATRTSHKIVCSNGADVSFDEDAISGEFVTQCVTPIDVEQYRLFSYDNFNVEGAKTLILEAIEDVRARARAKDLPKTGTYNIILKGEHIAEIMSFYGARSAASMVYPGYSKWKVGEKVQGEDIKGEKLNIFLEPTAPYSAEAIPMPERQLIEDGELKLIYGGTRFCRYLGIEPTGEYSKVLLKNGSVDYASMKTDGVLEPISFSDFQMDPMDGHFKGEIRLAYLYKADGTFETLTGGSINGSIIEGQNDLTFSKEKYKDASYEGPMAILIKNVAVAGK